MVIQHNMAAMFAHRQLGITTDIKAKSAEKLSSGYRINRAADDAAGLAISEKMRRQIRGLGQNMANIQDGISFIQVADGYLNEVHDMLQRINELSVKGANGTLTDTDRSYIDTEVQQIKDEIERIFKSASFNDMEIFKVPYAPSVTPNAEPYDTQIFYSSPGVIGGLEFNNVRYNLSELASKGMSLDASGNATKDQTVEFDLWDGEKVHLTLNEGDSLSKVTRKYEWKADDNGIKVNNVQVATWSSLGIAGNGNDEGTYSFDYHGTKVSFDVEERDTLADIIDGINGNSITEPSYWNISPSSATNRQVVQIPRINSVTVTNANKNNADDKYEILADTNGLSVKRTDKNDASDTSTTSVKSWSSFSNVGPAVPRTPGEGHDGSYPIKDWGLENDSNGSSSVTFDTEALYRYNTTIDNMQINYDFRLADVSSRDDVINAFNGTNLRGSVSTGTTTISSANNNALTINGVTNGITSGNESAFVLQRAYGRNFDDLNEDMTGALSWSSTKTGESPHNLDNTETFITQASNYSSTPKSYYYRGDDGKIYQRSDEVTTTVVDSYRIEDTYKWTQDYDVTISGNLGLSEMDDLSRSVTATFTQKDVTTYNKTTTTVSYGNDREITGDELAYLNQQIDDDNITLETNVPQAGSTSYESPRNKTTRAATLNSGTLTVNSNYAANNLPGAAGNAFNFNYRISYNDIVNTGSGNTAITVDFRQNASRSFNPSVSSNSVAEYDFMNIAVVPPRKELIIQATPEGILEDQIPINWSALNLSIIGMSGANTLSQEASLGSIDLTKEAINKISLERANFGATQNRLEHAYNYTANARENTQHSESVVRDTEMNSEIAKLRNHEILEQAGQAMLAQANQSKQGVLSLLQ